MVGKILQFPTGNVVRTFWGLDALIHDAIVASIPWNNQPFDRAFEATLQRINETPQQEQQEQ